MTRRANSHQAGFTLVELMLALAFLGFVLIFVTTTIIQVMRTYNKGLAVKEINQTARAVTDDISRIIRTSSPTAVMTGAVSEGRLCFGGVSYVWNFTNNTSNTYTDGSPIRMARVNDAGAAMCADTDLEVDNAQATELLASNVWVQQVAVTSGVGGSFYDVFLQLSTTDNSALSYDLSNPVLEQRVTCQGGSTGQFCAVASFSTTVNARGGVN